MAWRLRERPIAAVIGAVAFLVGLYAVFEMLAGFPLTEATIRWGALRIVPCFALGCALYLCIARSTLPRPGWIAGGVAVRHRRGRIAAGAGRPDRAPVRRA